MKCSWKYTTKATKDLKRLNQTIAQRIVKKIRDFCSSPDPMQHSQPLPGIFQGLYRFRIGDYRVVFRKKKSGQVIILLILRIKHRKDIYE